MTIGFRIHQRLERADADLLARFGGVATAHLSDNMSWLFAAGAQLRPMHRGGHMVGAALTVKVSGRATT